MELGSCKPGTPCARFAELLASMPDSLEERAKWLERLMLESDDRPLFIAALELIGKVDQKDSATLAQMFDEATIQRFDRKGLGSITQEQWTFLMNHPRLIEDLVQRMMEDEDSYWFDLFEQVYPESELSPINERKPDPEL